MTIQIFSDEQEGTLSLIDPGADRPVVLRVTHSKKYRNGDYAPSDLLRDDEYETFAAEVVYNWALHDCDSDAGFNAAQRYLQQWPDGPQIEEGDPEQMREEIQMLQDAGKDLMPITRDLTALSPKELLSYIEEMVTALEDCHHQSAHALILRLRIRAAAALLFQATQK